MPQDLPPEDVALLHDLRAGQRRALARAITLVESTRPDHRRRAVRLLGALDPPPDTLRIGLSGAPGVGKSSFVERFGLMLVGAGHRVAVLAVDPSSVRGGGAILGDKTRMDRLARDPRAFVRPSPAAQTLGGVARRTTEAIRLVEAAGHDVTLVETVGVGQSETAVAHMTDIFVLLIAPGGGDHLQGVKRGIMELADLLLVNKADGDLAAAAGRVRADQAAALTLMRRRPADPPGFPLAMTVSAHTGDGMLAAWDHIRALADWRAHNGHRDRTRAAQDMRQFRDALRAAVMDHVARHPAVAAAEAALRAQATMPSVAAETVAAALFAPPPNR